MDVKLVSITVPRIDGLTTAEDLLVYCARVSNPDNQLNTTTGDKLLSYCHNHQHWSVFELADFTVEITTSRAIAAQILRHKSFSFQEFSQRYARASMEFETYDARRQDTKNRQNSFDDLSDSVKQWFTSTQKHLQGLAQAAYENALDQGIAKESARFLLPLSTQTRLYMKGNLRSWITYLKVRCDPSTQKEHRDIAEQIKAIVIKEFPTIGGLL